MLVSELLPLIPHDTRKIVQQTKIRYNTAIRNILRAETRLSFQKAGDSEDREDSVVVVSVDQIGLPESLLHYEFGPEMELAAMLAPFQHHLRRLHDSAAAVNQMPVEVTRAIGKAQPQTAARFGHLDPCILLADELLKEAQKNDVLKEIFAINEDVLGRYTYDVDVYTRDVGKGSITLYWGVIGLVASILGVSVEGVTVNVLAHELAHAFTHLGFDIDGEHWSSMDFGKTSSEVKEGLAQYYSARCMEKLQSRVPDCYRAYKMVLPKQPRQYQVQVPWLESLSPEIVRICLVRARKKGPLVLEEFDQELCYEASHMRGSDKAGKSPCDFKERREAYRESEANQKAVEPEPPQDDFFG